MSSNERLIIDDLIVLGNACPDEMRDSRISVCTAGYSPSRGLIRIYPVPPISPMKRWNVVKVSLERNPTDARDESWKLQGSKAEWDTLGKKIVIKGRVDDRDQQIDLIETMNDTFGVDCVEGLNDAKRSLGMVRPNVENWELAPRDEVDETTQANLDGFEGFMTKKNYPYKPMVTYRCPECRLNNPHRQQILEWGLYEWMRRNPGDEEKVFENLHLGEDGYDVSFLVGNMARYPRSFVVISVFRFKSN